MEKDGKNRFRPDITPRNAGWIVLTAFAAGTVGYGSKTIYNHLQNQHQSQIEIDRQERLVAIYKQKADFLNETRLKNTKPYVLAGAAYAVQNEAFIADDIYAGMMLGKTNASINQAQTALNHLREKELIVPRPNDNRMSGGQYVWHIASDALLWAADPAQSTIYPDFHVFLAPPESSDSL